MFYWQGKEELRSQFNRMFWLGVVELGHVVNMDSQHFIEFEDAKRWLCTPPNYGFIWEKLHSIPLVGGYLPTVATDNAPWVDWRLKGRGIKGLSA